MPLSHLNELISLLVLLTSLLIFCIYELTFLLNWGPIPIFTSLFWSISASLLSVLLVVPDLYFVNWFILMWCAIQIKLYCTVWYLWSIINACKWTFPADVWSGENKLPNVSPFLTYQQQLCFCIWATQHTLLWVDSTTLPSACSKIFT